MSASVQLLYILVCYNITIRKKVHGISYTFLIFEPCPRGTKERRIIMKKIIAIALTVCLMIPALSVVALAVPHTDITPREKTSFLEACIMLVIVSLGLIATIVSVVILTRQRKKEREEERLEAKRAEKEEKTEESEGSEK